MKSKKIKLKYQKNPRTLIDRDDVQNYLWHLEEAKELDKLPLPFLVYYVVGCILTDEVNNGGFAQYLSNSSVQTLPYLEKCVRAIGNEDLIEIVKELLIAVSKDFNISDIKSIADAYYSDELETILSSLDDRFYSFDEKHDVEEISKKYYKDNLPEDKLVFELVKPKENDHLRYFVYDKSNITNVEALEALVAFLGEFSNIKFDIEINKWGEMFRIYAIDRTNSLNLGEIFAHFDDDSYSFGGNSCINRCKILGLKFDGGIFKEINVDSIDEENWRWRLTIKESNFDDNEYEISYCRFSSSFGSKKKASSIFVGDFDEKSTNIKEIKDFFEKAAKTQHNINNVKLIDN